LTSERFEVHTQKLLNKINVLVCVVYIEIKAYREERKKEHTEIYSGSANVG